MAGKRCFVYAIGAQGGPLKIGMAGDPAKRLRQLQHASPCAVAVVGLWRFTSREIASQVEARAHHALDARRLRGEWFDCSPEDAAVAVAAAITWVRNRRSNVSSAALRTVHLRAVR